MADLSSIEKRKLERLLGMGSGYVLNFSDRTFAEFIDEAVRRNIYDEKYSFKGTSKARHLRAFWEVEPNQLVGKLTSHLLEYIRAERIRHDATDFQDAQNIAKRLQAASGLQEPLVLADLGEGRDFEAVAAAVRDSIERDEPATGLDRLHTFTTKYLRTLCERVGIATDRDKPLHALMGEYRRYLHEHKMLESEMTGKILKASSQLLQDFNDVRNNQSLAHDNKLLNHDEALLIFNLVTSALRFLRELEKRLEREKRAAAEVSALADPDADDIPF